MVVFLLAFGISGLLIALIGSKLSRAAKKASMKQWKDIYDELK